MLNNRNARTNFWEKLVLAHFSTVRSRCVLLVLITSSYIIRQVLSKYDNNYNHRILCLYLTDYTRLAHKNYAHRAEWINGADPDTVLLLELWCPDPPFAEGQKLEKGDVVSLKNVRLNLDRDGNVKMKMSDAKIHKVFETDSTPVVRRFFEWVSAYSFVLPLMCSQTASSLSERQSNPRVGVSCHLRVSVWRTCKLRGGGNSFRLLLLRVFTQNRCFLSERMLTLPSSG